MARFVWHDNRWCEAVRSAPRPRAFMIGRDSMPDTVHPITGVPMDSKSQFRRVTREHGYEELGNDWKQEHKPYEPSQQEVEQSISDAWDKCEAGYVPPPVETPPELRNIETKIFA